MRENTDQNKSKYGQFSRSDTLKKAMEEIVSLSLEKRKKTEENFPRKILFKLLR